MSLADMKIPSDAQRALDRAIVQHLFDPNVSLVDLGLRIRDSQNQKIEGELCVRVHVRTKLHAEAFGAFAARYPHRVVDSERIGFAVDVPQAKYRIQPWPWWLMPVWMSPDQNRRGAFDPMCGGISISNGLRFNYGTLGGKVLDRETGAEMILSNWHVLVGSWFTWPDLPIYQPGRGDGGHAEHTVAYLTRHAMDQLIDAAVAEISGSRTLLNDQLGLGPVTGVGTPLLGQQVTKSGRRTGITTGVITGIEGRQAIQYNGVPRVIRHVVHIAQGDDGGLVSAPGDSGSWWLEKESRRAIGLHFAGSDEPEYGLAMAMPQVLDALNVDILPDAEPIPEASERYRDSSTLKRKTL